MRKKIPIPATIEIPFEPDDLEESLHHQKGLWLGCYSPEQLRQHLEQHGVLQHLAERGFSDPELQLECEPFSYTLRITGGKGRDAEPQLLVEVKARRTTESLIGQLGRRTYSTLVLDWVLFQDPSAEFNEDHPPLPGQKHPGLHLLRQGIRLLLGQVQNMEVDLVLTYPQHFHNAFFYAPQFRFLEPVTEGHFQALVRDLLKDTDLARASAALDEGEVLDDQGRPVFWMQKAQAWPHNQEIEEELFGKEFEAAQAHAREQRFRFK